MRRILSVLLENESGALSRVVGLFSQRAFNIESLTVAPTDDPTLSRMTIEAVGDEQVLEQIEKQLHKLVDVFKVIKTFSRYLPWSDCGCNNKILHNSINRYKR